MAHLIADVLRALPLGDEHGREEVPQIMEPDVREAGASGYSTEDELVKVVRVYAFAARSGEHQTGSVLGVSLEAAKQFKDSFRCCHTAV